MSRIGRPDFRCRKLGHLGRSGSRPAGLDFYSALITPPQPFAEAERKASPNGLSINLFCASCLRPNRTFPFLPGDPGSGHGL